MRTAPLLAAATIAILASCSDRSTPTAPRPTTPSLSYSASASPAVILGGYNNSSYTIPYGINDLGVITGTSGQPDNAVRWPTGTAVVPASIGALFVSGPGDLGRDINVAGQIAGEHANHAALWTPNGAGYTLTDIGNLFEPDAIQSFAYGINAAGDVVGNYTIQVGADLVTNCFLWKPGVPNGVTGTAITLTDLGGNFCVGNHVTATGQVVGAGNYTLNGPNHAIVWNVPGTPIDLMPGVVGSYGVDINEAGQVAGFQHLNGPSAPNAAVWTPTGPGTWSRLDLAPPLLSGQLGTVTSLAVAINDAGFVVGITNDQTIIRAFFWQDGTFTELTHPDALSPAIVEPSALTNLIGDRVIVSGSDIFDPANNGRHGLRWAVSLAPTNSVGCLADLTQLINGLRGSGALSDGDAKSLLAKVDAATKQANQGKTMPAKNLLLALIDQVNLLRAAGTLSITDAQALIQAAQCAISEL
jgi:uncharacterized membrane protein